VSFESRVTARAASDPLGEAPDKLIMAENRGGNQFVHANILHGATECGKGLLLCHGGVDCVLPKGDTAVEGAPQPDLSCGLESIEEWSRAGWVGCATLLARVYFELTSQNSG
jgi:hypothetical protein